MRSRCSAAAAALSLVALAAPALAQDYSTYGLVPPTANVGSSAGRAPALQVRYNRSHSIYTAAEFPSELTNGDQIVSLGFEILTPPSVTTTGGTLTIYMQNTTDATNTKSATWSAAITGMTSVYSGPFNLTNTQTSVRINLTTPFTYTGNNVYIAFDYQNPIGTIAGTGTPVYLADNVLANSTRSVTGATLPATLGALSAFRPAYEFGISPVGADIAARMPDNEVLQGNDIYFAGDVAAGPQSLAVAIRNVGTSADINITGVPSVIAETGLSGTTITGSLPAILAPGEESILTIDTVVPATLGLSSYTVSIPNDDPNESPFEFTVFYNIPLSGTYLVSNDPTEMPDFPSVDAALTALNDFGVGGPTVIEISEGVGPYTVSLDTLLFQVNTTPVNTLTIRSQPGERAVIEGSAAAFYAARSGCLIIARTSHVTVSDLEFRGGLDYGVAFISDIGSFTASDFTCERNIIHDITRGSAVTIWGNGVALPNINISNNLIYDVAGNNTSGWGTNGGGVLTWLNVGTNNTVSHNTIYGRAAVGSSTTAIVRTVGGAGALASLNFNIFTSEVINCPIYRHANTPLAAEQNLYHVNSASTFSNIDSSFAAWQTRTGLDANSASADPLFLDTTIGSENFTLSACSIGIDFATASFTATDLFSTPRPLDLAAEVGAIESPAGADPNLRLERGLTQFSDDSFDLVGTGLAPSTTIPLTYVIANTGTAQDLNIAGFTILAQTNCTVTVITAPAAVVPPGQTTIIDLDVEIAATDATLCSFIIEFGEDSQCGDGTFTLNVELRTGLGGTYLVSNDPGELPDFADLGELFDTLLDFGQFAAVTANLSEGFGTYFSDNRYILINNSPLGLTIQAEPGESPEISGNGVPHPLNAAATGPLHFQNCQNVTLRGITFSGGVGYQLSFYRASVASPGSGLVVENCRFINGGGLGLYVAGNGVRVADVTVRGSEFYNLGIGSSPIANSLSGVMLSLGMGALTTFNTPSNYTIEHNSFLINSGGLPTITQQVTPAAICLQGATTVQGFLNVRYNVVEITSTGYVPLYLQGLPANYNALYNFNVWANQANPGAMLALGAGGPADIFTLAAWQAYATTTPPLDPASTDASAQFRNTLALQEDLRVFATSPARNLAVGSTATQDIAGLVRLAGFVDAGAHQFHGDYNNDLSVTSFDLATMLSSFGLSVTPPIASDFNSDGAVNGFELGTVLEVFGQ